MEKVFKNSVIYLICVAILFCISFSFGFSNNKVFAQSESPKIVSYGNISNFSFVELSMGHTTSFHIQNFDFENNDVIQYYYIKQSASNFVYDKLNSEKIVISDENIEDLGEIEIKLNDKFGLGTYTLKCSIFRGEEIIATPTPLSITINDPESTTNNKLNLIIAYSPVQDSNKELGTYKFEATLKQGDKVINIDQYNIFWFFTNGDTKIPFTNKSVFEWAPTETGMFNVKARIDTLNLESEDIEIVIVKDYSLKLILVCVGVAVIMLGYVIISTIISVKKERVW